MSSNLIERNPFRPKSALSSIYEALARAQKPLEVDEVAKRAKVPLERTSRMLAAMANPFHNAGMRRTGVALLREDGLLSLKGTKPDSDAKRPARGVKSKNGKKQAKAARRNGKKKSAAQAGKPKAEAAPKQAAKAAAARNTVPEGAEAKNLSLNEREKLVLSTLGESPKPVDAVVTETKLRVEEVLATLLVLEVRRLAVQHPGKAYSKSEAK